MKRFSKIAIVVFAFLIFVTACKKTNSGPTPTPSGYYITYSVNGVLKNFNNSVDVCAVSDTTINGQNMGMCAITGATNALPVEVLQIIIIGDTSNLVSNTFTDTATAHGYTLVCNHSVPGNIDYSTYPFNADTISSVNPFQITFNAITNGVASGTFQGNLYDTETGNKVYTITNGKFYLPVKHS